MKLDLNLDLQGGADLWQPTQFSCLTTKIVFILDHFAFFLYFDDFSMLWLQKKIDLAMAKKFVQRDSIIELHQKGIQAIEIFRRLMINKSIKKDD